MGLFAERRGLVVNADLGNVPAKPKNMGMLQ